VGKRGYVEYAASSLVGKYIDNYYTAKIEVCPEEVVINTGNEKYNAFFYLTDC